MPFQELADHRFPALAAIEPVVWAADDLEAVRVGAILDHEDRAFRR